MNESKPNSGWNESKPSFPIAMNVDEAMAIVNSSNLAAEWYDGSLSEAVGVLRAEVERLRAEVEMSHSFHRVAVKERDFERLLVEALKEELAAAKADTTPPEA